MNVKLAANFSKVVTGGAMYAWTNPRYQRPMNVISTTDELGKLCTTLSQSSFVTVDTEFVRETTFWPELCLIQLAGEDCDAIVDPLAEGLDLTPFFALMANEQVVKVFHAARQDIEIIHNLADIVPVPIFDTQVAAMVCGFGESVSYQNLVKKLLNEDLDKSSQFTDWKARPLSERQLSYALADVTHLRPIYLHLTEHLEDTGRAHWLSEEMAILCAKETYVSHPEDAWRRMKMRVKSKRAMAIMMEIASWRETVAQSTNIPRQRVLKDEAIYDISNQAPKDKKSLSRLRTIHDGIAKSERGDAIVAAVAAGLKRDLAEIPSPKRGTPLTADVLAIVELLKVHLKSTSARFDVASKLIATSDDLEKIAQDDNASVPALKGWRRELFGEDALALKRGELAIALRNGRVEMVRIEPSS